MGDFDIKELQKLLSRLQEKEVQETDPKHQSQFSRAIMLAKLALAQAEAEALAAEFGLSVKEYNDLLKEHQAERAQHQQN